MSQTKEEYEAEKEKAMQRLLFELEEGWRSGEEEGWHTHEEVVKYFEEKFKADSNS